MRRFFVALLIGVAVPAKASPVDRWRPFIAEASARFGVPETWIIRVMRAESGGHTHRGGAPIRSRAGAIGLMQLMPQTWAMVRRAQRLGADPDDPRDNILAGTAYLRLMYDRFGYPGLFAAYNAGPARYAAYLADRRPLPTETIAYVGRTGTMPDEALPPPAAPLFAVRRESVPGGDPPVARDSALFFIVRAPANAGARTAPAPAFPVLGGPGIAPSDGAGRQP